MVGEEVFFVDDLKVVEYVVDYCLVFCVFDVVVGEWYFEIFGNGEIVD